MMRYDKILKVRIPAELEEKLRQRAKTLQVSVATLARWGLRFAATTSDVMALLTQETSDTKEGAGIDEEAVGGK